MFGKIDTVTLMVSVNEKSCPPKSFKNIVRYVYISEGKQQL